MLDAMLMQQISVAIFLFGMVYVFGTYIFGRLLAGMEHEVGHDVDQDVDHDVDHDIDQDVDHDFEHDYDASHELDHDYDHDHDVGHAVEAESEVEHDYDHHIEGVISEHFITEGGYFEASAGVPISLSIGTFLLTFGFIGMVLYSDKIVFEILTKLGIHVGLTLLVYTFVRTVISKVFKETGFCITYGDMIGHRVLAMSTISRDFGEVRGRTEMGLRRFHARPAEAATIYQKGLELYVVAADERLLYVHHHQDVSEVELENLMADYTTVDGKKVFFRKRIVSECSYCNHLNDSESLSCTNCGGPLERLVAMKFLKEEVSELEHA